MSFEQRTHENPSEVNEITISLHVPSLHHCTFCNVQGHSQEWCYKAKMTQGNQANNQMNNQNSTQAQQFSPALSNNEEAPKAEKINCTQERKRFENRENETRSEVLLEGDEEGLCEGECLTQETSLQLLTGTANANQPS